MKIGRREFVAASVGTVADALLSSGGIVHGESKMYGLIGKMTAAEGKRDELIKILSAALDFQKNSSITFFLTDNL